MTGMTILRYKICKYTNMYDLVSNIEIFACMLMTILDHIVL